MLSKLMVTDEDGAYNNLFMVETTTSIDGEMLDKDLNGQQYPNINKFEKNEDAVWVEKYRKAIEVINLKNSENNNQG